MKLAIVLITCEREDYTRKTCELFARHNGWCANAPFDVRMYHIDDASTSDENMELARQFGYETLHQHFVRRGNTVTRVRAIEMAAEACEPTHIMLLENDWECLRPMPWEAIQFAMEHPEHDIYHLRLWHHFKYRTSDEAWDGVSEPPFRGHKGRRNAPEGWVPLEGAPEPMDIGDGHWGAPPSITRTKETRWLHHNATSEQKSRVRSGLIQARCARVKKNVFYHIGDERTPGFIK